MSLSHRVVFMAAGFMLGAALAPAAPLSFAPAPVAGSSSCPVEAWGCETTGTPAFGNGWQVVSGNVDFVNNAWWTFLNKGEVAIDLSGSMLGSIANTVTGLTVGKQYTLTFLWSYNPDDSVNLTRQANISVTNAGGFSFELGPSANATNGEFGSANNGPIWNTFSQTFTATATTATIRFTSEANQYQGIVLRDSVNLQENANLEAAVPEPATIGIMGIGLLCFGLKRFRRS